MIEILESIGHSLLVNVLEALLVLVLAAIVMVAVRYFQFLTEKLKNERPDAYKFLYAISVEAVHAAEQLGLNGLIQDKKKYALDYVQAELDRRGLGFVDVDAIEAKVEAAVYAEINSNKR